LRDEHRSKEDLISELHRLRQRNKDLEAISPDGFYILDDLWRFTYISSKAEPHVEKPPEELLGKCIWEELPAYVGTPVYDCFHSVADNRVSIDFETLTQHTKRWYEVNVSPGEPGIYVMFREITKRKLAERELQRSRQETIDLLESISDSFVAFDKDLRFTYLNQAAEKIMGCSRESRIGQKLEDVSPQVDPLALKKYRQVLLEKTPQEIEIYSNAVQRWLNITVNPSRNGISVYFRDITERIQAEETLATERKRFNDVLELLPAYLILLTPDYHVSFANRFFRERFGEFYGRRCFEYLFGRSAPCENCETYKVLKTMSPHEWEWVGPDGRNYHIYDFPFTDVDGSTLIMEMGIDITELKIKEEALRAEIEEHNRTENYLRQSEEKFSKAFHGMPIMMALVTHDKEEYLDVNKAWELGTGYTTDEVIGRTTEEINLWVGNDKSPDIMRKLEEHERIENHEIQFRTKAGEIRSGLIWSQIVFIGEKKCQLTARIDITEQKRTEQEMLRLDRLNLIGEMAASIGHEIRNPMTAVRGFIQLLNEQECYAKDKVYFELMIEELDRANGIISEYLSMARDKTVDLQPEYLDQVVKTIKPMLDADANHKEMNIKLELGRPPMPLIDQKEIRQVILNLARNGMEAMSPGGTLTIGTTVKGGDIVLFVKDEGHGLDPDILEKLGTPFLTTKDNGTGLGLAVCYSIAARHNARIDFETGPKGTTFYVYLPMYVQQTLSFS